jgi:ATP-dependent DNA helicase RecQ
LYGGELFSAFGNISVQHVAHFIKITPQEVKKQLQVLDRLALIQYCPQKATPQLTFTTTRHPAASLPLDKKILKQRTAIAKEKAEAVVHYTTHPYRCRAQLLLEYFGETTYQKCGQCDVCLTKGNKEGNLSTDDYQQYRHLVLQRLQVGMQELNQIVDSVDLTAEETILATIRQMLDNGELVYDNASRLIQTRNLRPNQGH